MLNRKKRLFTRMLILICCVALALALTGCMPASEEETSALPEIPARLNRTDDGVPVLSVYDTSAEKTEEMDVETYLMGVVAGEMKNTWPMEALKAQAILARTFTMKFVSDKTSSYENADISTDVTEAQAYNAEDINDRVREAVNETRGLVIIADGEFPYAWFHAHSGGKTELPSKALDYSEDPSYLTSVTSDESSDAPEDVQNWKAVFTREQVLQACRNAGLELNSVESFEIGQRGESGRAATFLVNGQEVSAPTFRLQIGASALKSTLLESVEIDGDSVVFKGSGFGHGVGMSQWGARKMADDGKSAEDIIMHYYTGVELAELW